MSIHSTLKPRKAKLRSVLKRHERLAKAIREEKWLKGMSVYGLPKFNPIRFKIKKSDETKTVSEKIDILEEHKLAKEKDKKQKKNKKEVAGRK